MISQQLNRLFGSRLLSTLGRAAAVATLTLALACGDNGTGPDEGGEGGTPTGSVTTGLYTLRTVNGDAVPTTVYEEPGYKYEIVSASVNLKTDASFIAIMRDRETIDGVAETYTDTSYGTWSKSGTTVTFTDDVGDTFDATLNTAGLTIAGPAGGMTMVFKK